ncbi:hypothetical protein TRAPUB_2734 [Trametes pubescens]|uniref:Uncharacterized protein n=1 Tax=Trametes pubescens TaxID=154538 RepID=A0A1M2VFS9_TRAPU|nr:hypothetical protein TRAPUB_2734 [Trametes pubescens]
MDHQALSELTRSNVQSLAKVVEEAARLMRHAKRTTHEGAVLSSQRWREPCIHSSEEHDGYSDVDMQATTSVHADHPEALKEDNPRTGETPLPSALWSNPLYSATCKSPRHLSWTTICALRQPQCCRRGPQVPPTLASALSRQTSLLDTGRASRTMAPLDMPAGIGR